MLVVSEEGDDNDALVVQATGGAAEGEVSCTGKNDDVTQETRQKRARPSSPTSMSSSKLVIEEENWPNLEGASVSLGIDEAGRGPVLGPLVYAVFFCRIGSDPSLRQLGVDDSKKTTEEQREEIFKQLVSRRKEFGWKIHSIGPQELSAKMLRGQKYNLNEISHDTAIGLIRSCVDKGFNVKEVFVDTVGKSQTYQRKLEQLFPGLKITVAEKADSLFATVGAASIFAKVTRDHQLYHWSFDELEEMGNEKSSAPFPRRFGSGYPGDDVTKKFLDDVLDPIFGFPSIARFSWGTVKLLLEKRAVQVDWFGDEEGATGGSGGGGGVGGHSSKSSMLLFFQKKPPNATVLLERSHFCLRNRIESVADLE